MLDPKVVDQVSSELSLYVYLLVDPRTNVPFYVGKGRGLRHASHLAEAVVAQDDENASAKVAHIRELIDNALTPEVWILRYGLNEREYTQVEAAAIDLLMTFPLQTGPTRVPLAVEGALTNARREEARGHGILPLQALVDEFAAPPLTSERPLLLITLNGSQNWPEESPELVAAGRPRWFTGWRPEWYVSSERERAFDEIGFAASAWWYVTESSARHRGVEHVAVIHREVTRGLYRIEPGSWETRAEGVAKNGRKLTRSAFALTTIPSGQFFDEVVGPHGHRVPRRTGHHRQSSVYYWPPD